MGGRGFAVLPLTSIVKNSIVKIEYLKKYEVNKYENTLPRCMDLDLCNKYWMESIGSVVLATLIAQFWLEEE